MRKLIEKLAYWILKKVSSHSVPFNNLYLVDKLPMDIAVYDREGRYVYVNENYCPDEAIRKKLIGRDDYFYFEQINANQSLLTIRNTNRTKALEKNSKVHFLEAIHWNHKENITYYYRNFLPIEGGKYVLSYGSNRTAMFLAQKELKYLAHHDKLTGLHNRDAFNEQVDQVLREQERVIDGTIVALLFCDLDNFKLVNDSHGHDHGDMVLKEVADRFRKTLRKSDQIFRIGGDEFVVVLRNLKNDFEAGLVAQKLIHSISQPYVIGEISINYVSMCIGIVLVPHNGLERESLVKKADTAMYHAKKRGKKGYRFYSEELTEATILSLKMEKNLRELVINRDFGKQFDIEYQPIYGKDNAHRYRIVGSEVLVRWNNPDIGYVHPGHFIPVAEKSDLIIPIGQWVLERALKDFRKLEQSAKVEKFYVSVNLSAKQLHSKELVKVIQEVINRFGIDPEKLQFELTETSYLAKDEQVYDNLKALRNIGVKIAIDDFGSGYASMVYLQRVPASTLKIDRSFVRHLAGNEHHRELVRSIIQLGKNLNMDIVAEGVEDWEQLQFLEGHNCDRFQGFLFSKPISFTKLNKELELNRPVNVRSGFSNKIPS